MINKIIIIGQLLRDDYTSCEWIFKLFEYYLNKVTGLPVFCTVPQNYIEQRNEKYIPINVQKIYNDYGVIRKEKRQVGRWQKGKDWENAWAEIYYRTEYNKSAYEYIYSIFKDSLVISYEVEDCISAVFDYYNIPQIDINMDPIRFLEDVMLCFRTKNKAIYKKLLKYRVDEEFLYLSANYLKTNYSIGKYPNPKEKCVLFLGQTGCDKTLIVPEIKEIYTILDHKEDFKNAVSGFDKILYKTHPLAVNDKANLDFMCSLGNVEIVNKNFYELISQDNIKKVVSVSSGTCSEAQYFGKEIQNLLREGVPRQTENKVDINKYVSIYQHTLSLNFWSDILSPVIKTKKYDKLITIAGTKNKLRNSRIEFPIYWGYQDFDNLKLEKKIKQTMSVMENFLDE